MIIKQQGSFYPFRVLIKGTLNALTYIVVRPNGEYYAGFYTAREACKCARSHARAWHRQPV